MNYKLDDLISIPLFQNLQDKMNEIFPFSSAIIDDDGNILTATGWQDVCTNFHRLYPQSEIACKLSDQYIKSHIHEANPAVCYQCIHGLVDCAFPIILEGKHLGNFFIGQFFLEKPDLDFFREQGKKYSFEEKSYLEAVAKVPVWSQSQLEKYVIFLKSFTEALAEMGLTRLKDKETRNIINEKEEQLRLALKATNQGLWDFNLLTGNGIFSPELSIILGYDPAEYTLSLATWSASLHPNDKEKSLRALDQYLHGEKSEYIIEYRMKTKSGEWKWLLSQGKIVSYNDDGTPLRMVGTHTDITDRKKAEEELRLANLYNRSLIEASLDPFVTIGPSGKITDVNAATEQATGYSRNELIGKDFSDFFTKPEQAKAGYQKAFLEGSVHDYPLEIRNRDGHITPVLYNAVIYNDENGKVIGVFAAARDITDLKKVEQELRKLNDELDQRVIERTAQLTAANTELKNFTSKLERSNRDLQEFAYIASHDLQEPLRKVMAFGDRLAIKYDDKLDETGKDYLKRMRDACQRMQTLINDLLSLSRVSTHAQEFTEVDLNTVVQEISADLENQIERTHARLEIGNLPVVMADETQIRQVFQNLIGNALKFYVENRPPVIKLTSSLQTDTCLISVEDNGIGFDIQYLDRIFKPFQRLHSREEFEGSGMGLAICRRIIERHGGSITATSTLGKGSIFLVTLPIHQQKGEK